MNDFEYLFPLGAQSESSLKEAKVKSVAIWKACSVEVIQADHSSVTVLE